MDAGSHRPTDRGRVVAVALAVYGVAWLLRFLYVVHLRASPLFDAPMLDELYHVEWARGLAAGDWVGSAAYFRAPFYPYLLGAAFALLRGSLFAARIVQVTYGALTPVVVLLIGRRVLGRAGGVLAAAIAAVYPFFIYFDNELLIVSLVVLLDSLLVLAVLRADEVPSWGRWLLAGVIAGLSAIARPSVLVFVPVVFAWIWWRALTGGARRGPARGGLTPVTGSTAPRTALMRIALILVGIAIVVSPVTFRNYILSQDFVLISSQGGVNFFIGNNAQADGVSAVVPGLGEAWEYETCVRIAEQEQGRRLRPSEVSGYWYRRGWAFVAGEPVRAVKLLLKKSVLFWNRFELANNKDVYHFGRMSPIFRGLSWLHFGLIAPLAALGCCVIIGRRRGAVLLALFVLFYSAGVVAFFVNARFRLPVLPFLVVFAAAGLIWLVEKTRGREFRALAAGGAILAAVALFVNVDFYGTHVGERAQTHHTIALAHAQKGEDERAVREYERAIEISPGYAKAHSNMGLALQRLGRQDEARDSFLKAAELDEHYAAPRNHIGNMLWMSGDREAAARWFAEAAESDPWEHTSHYYLAQALFRLERFESAEESFRRALAIRPRYAEAWYALGVLYERTDRKADALAAYTLAVQIAPAYTGARNNLAVLLAETGQFEEALREFKIALEHAPGDPRLLENLEGARALMREGDRGDGR